jgi:hypothetical protein
MPCPYSPSHHRPVVLLPSGILHRAQSRPAAFQSISSGCFCFSHALHQTAPASNFLHPSFRSKTMLKQTRHVVVDIEQWPMKTGPVAHDFDLRKLRLARSFETLQSLSWNGNLQPVGKIEADQILLRFIQHSSEPGIEGLEILRACDGRIDLAAGNLHLVRLLRHAFSPTARLTRQNGLPQSSKSCAHRCALRCPGECSPACQRAGHIHPGRYRR